MNKSEKQIFETLLSSLSEDKKVELITKLASKSTTRKSAKKSSINGAPLTLESVEVVESNGYVSFKHPQYKEGRKGGYAIADLKTAQVLIEAKKFTGENKMTGTKFVLVEGKPYGENIVKLAETAGFLND